MSAKKTSIKWNKKFEKLYASLRKNKKTIKHTDMPIIENLTLSILCSYMSPCDANVALSKLKSTFVDFNEIRVTKTSEIVDVLSLPAAAIPAITELNAALMSLFVIKGRITLEFLHEEKITAINKLFKEKFKSISKEATTATLLLGLNYPRMPISEVLVNYAKVQKISRGKITRTSLQREIEKGVPQEMLPSFFLAYSQAAWELKTAEDEKEQIKTLALEKAKAKAASKKEAKILAATKAKEKTAKAKLEKKKKAPAKTKAKAKVKAKAKASKKKR